MKGIFGLLLAGAAHASKFDDFVREYAPIYENDAERTTRKALFEAHLEEIIAHNNDATQTYRRGINAFSDRRPEERGRHRGLDRAVHRLEHARGRRGSGLLQGAQGAHPTIALKPVEALPAAVDWREQGVITPVKNQGSCGSCWAFASAETVESHWAIKTGKLQELSEQFLLDCAPNPHHCGGTGGCMGGTAEVAFARLQEVGGLPSEWTYPYVSGTGTAATCHGLPMHPEHAHSADVMKAANVTGYIALTENSYAEVMNVIATIGPLAVSVDAGAWHDYESGIFTGGNRTHPELDHLVQLVGYGEEDGRAYWLVRNSWTPLWGENGYIRLARYGEDQEPCGVDVNPADGNGCDDGPTSVRVCGQSGILYDGVLPLVD